MSAIFISYRREDSEGHAGRLFELLCERFGKQSVFMDVAGIEPGLDFRKVIDAKVTGCTALLAVIGKSWLSAKDAGGQRRLDDPHDFVRLETASALKRDIPVIPVLVHGARMPRADELPPDMVELAFRNGVELTHARWDSDVEVLVRSLERHGAQPLATTSPAATHTASAAAPAHPSAKIKYAAIAAVAAALAGGGALLYEGEDEAPKKSPENDIAQGQAQSPTAAGSDAALKVKSDEEAAKLAAQREAEEAKLKQEAASKAKADEQAAKQEAALKAKAEEETARRAAARAQEEKLATEADVAKRKRLRPQIPDPSTQAENTPTTITFANDGTRAADLIWVDGAGKETTYLRLQPGQTHKQQTFVTHKWLVREADTRRELARARGAAEAATVRFGQAASVQGAAVNGRTVTRVEFQDGNGGSFQLAAPGRWVETGPSGNDVRFRFQETGRDDWSVYLYDKSRNFAIQLDLYRRLILMQAGNEPERKPLYRISASSAQ